MTYEVTLASGKTLYYNNNGKLVGYDDPQTGMCVDTTVEKEIAKTPKAEPKVENGGWRFSLFGTYKPSGAVGCGGDVGPSRGPGPQVDQLYDDGVNITPDAGDGGVAGGRKLSSDQLFSAEGQPEWDPAGERYVIQPIQIDNVHLWGENLSEVENLYIVIESDSSLIQEADLNPEYVGEDYEFGAGFACVPGMVNLSTIDPITDAGEDHIRLPLSVTEYSITEERTGETSPSAADYSKLVHAVCGSLSSGKPVKIPVPAAFYADDQLKININLKVEVDATNVYDLNTQYLTYLRIRLVAE